MVLNLLQSYRNNAYNYYLENGRSGEEIKKWLKSRKWFEKFRKNCLAEEMEGSDEESAIINCQKVIDGEYGKDTISSAFCWKDTEEGTKYWGKKEKSFLKWYYGQSFDIKI